MDGCVDVFTVYNLRSFHCMNLCMYMYRVYNVLCNIFIQREMWARSKS